MSWLDRLFGTSTPQPKAWDSTKLCGGVPGTEFVEAQLQAFLKADDARCRLMQARFDAAWAEIERDQARLREIDEHGGT